jgi:hypothetical protein
VWGNICVVGGVTENKEFGGEVAENVMRGGELLNIRCIGGELLNIRCINFLENVSATFVTPKKFSHTPLMLHISRSTVYIHSSFSN